MAPEALTGWSRRIRFAAGPHPLVAMQLHPLEFQVADVPAGIRNGNLELRLLDFELVEFSHCAIELTDCGREPITLCGELPLQPHAAFARLGQFLEDSAKVCTQTTALHEAGSHLIPQLLYAFFKNVERKCVAFGIHLVTMQDCHVSGSVRYQFQQHALIHLGFGVARGQQTTELRDDLLAPVQILLEIRSMVIVDLLVAVFADADLARSDVAWQTEAARAASVADDTAATPAMVATKGFRKGRSA
mmetsp:Transcript_1616/g.3704  ORF Transcript_1616/g.3704 Transcript_1616/m.3704 type:complete len:246 (-) Transcript_1616:264-1001(-)